MEGLRNLPTVMSIADRQAPDIICLQETLLRTYRNVELAEALRDYTWIFRNADTDLHVEDQLMRKSLSFHGVAMGISKARAEKMKQLHVGCKNVICVNLEINSTNYLVFNLYLPCRKVGNDEKFEHSLDAITAVIEEHGAEAKVLMMGDLNVEKESTQRRISAWLNFVDHNGLRDNVTGIPSHHHHVTGVRNELDRFLERDLDLQIEQIRDMMSTSDHTPIMASVKLLVKAPPAQVKGDPVETKINIQKLVENIEIFREITEDIADEFEAGRGRYSLDTQNAMVSTYVYQAALVTTGQPNFQSQRERKAPKVKIPKQLMSALRDARRAHGRQHNKSRASPTGRRLTHVRMEIRNFIKIKRDKRDIGLQMKITAAARDNNPKLFSLLSKTKEVNTATSNLPSKIEGYGKTFYTPDVLPGIRELFRLQTTMDFNERFSEDKLEMARDVIWARKGMEWTEEEFQKITITDDEFAKLVRGLKTGKAQDFLGMSNDLMKSLGPKMTRLIHRISQESLDNNDVGGYMRNYGKGTVIIKKFGMDPTLIKSWRKIVVNNTILNITQLHLQPSIEEKVKRIQEDSQLGFTRGIPVSNAVVARQELQNLSKVMKRTLFLGVLDLQSCFPRICREQALHLASDILTPAEWEVLAQIYTDTWGEIRVQAQKSKPAPGDIGTIEGGILSVQILKLYIARLLKMIREAGFDGGVDFGEVIRLRPGAIGVADDILLYSWDEGSMKEMLGLCQHWSDSYRATFSPDKSVILIQRTRGDRGEYTGFELNGQELKLVAKAEHLGVELVEDGDNSEIHMDTRLSKGRRAVAGSLSLYNPRSFINPATKLELWRMKFRSVVLYAQDTTMMKMSTMARLEQYQSKLIKSALGLSRRAADRKVRILAGATLMSTQVWKNRFGALNNILIGTTMVKPICVAAWHLRLKGTWTYQTVKKLDDILQDEGLDDKIKAADIFLQPRLQYKETVKNILLGRETRRISKELEIEPSFRLQPDPFKTVPPMINSDFSDVGKRLVRAFAQVYAADFYRAYGGERCLLCRHRLIMEEESNLFIDNTTHILSGLCVIDEKPEVQLKTSEMMQLIERIDPSHIVTSQMVDTVFKVRFILNPTDPSLGKHRIPADVLQHSGLDVSIKKLCLTKIEARTEMLRQRGFIVNRKK